MTPPVDKHAQGKSNRERGTQFERDTAKRLRRGGWLVLRSRGSLGPADLVALGRGMVLLVQCKVSADDGEAMTHGEWNDLLALAQRLDVMAIVADRPSRGVYRFRQIIGAHVERRHVWPATLFPIDRATWPAPVAAAR